jgi:hypothetical protein
MLIDKLRVLRKRGININVLQYLKFSLGGVELNISCTE